ncbi:MAG: FHA domain-containing protein [Planctomycetota bacterium]|nr:FHA domain-containing protein [Planctomycetota bacterium]MDG2144310.1 FHA domain-containing protein [Planctomycetota bacterium]
MPDRYSLRIESGDRAGETIALSGRGLTVGRRPANDLSLTDASVSGRHARLGIEDGQVVLVDFGSTNGTFVADVRVEEQDLKGGDRLRFGKVEVLFLDAEDGAAPAQAPAAMPAAAPASPAASEDDFDLEIELDGDLDLEIEEPAAVPAMSPPESAPQQEAVSFSDLEDDADNEVHEIDAEAMAKASGGKSSMPLIAAALVIAGGAAWYFAGMPGVGGGDAGGGAPALRPVATIPGNLVKDASFEDEATSAWSASDTAPVTAYLAGDWRASGANGMGADLEPGEWALLRSASIKLGLMRGLRATADAFAEDGAACQIGLGLSDSTGDHPSMVAWSAAGDGADMALDMTAAPGYDTVRVLLRASAEDSAGAAGFDDVGLVASSASSEVSFGDFTVAPAGYNHAVVYHIDRPLLIDFGVEEASLAAAAGEAGLEFQIMAGTWSVILDPALLSEGMATLGDGGYRPHGDAFEDAGVTSVVIGRGAHQMQLVFPSPVTLKGTPLSLGYKLEAQVNAGTLQLALGFSEQRSEAIRLHSRAEQAVAKGDRGKAVRTWQTLLETVPFDYDLVAQSEVGRGAMVDEGLADLADLRGDFERAKFFGLPELFATCLGSARDLETEFAGCEVSVAAGSFGDEVADQLRELTGSGESGADSVRGAILAHLEDAGHSGLAAELRASLTGTKTAK